MMRRFVFALVLLSGCVAQCVDARSCVEMCAPHPVIRLSTDGCFCDVRSGVDGGSR